MIANQNAEKAKAELEKAKAAVEARAQQSQFDIKAYELVEKALTLDPSTHKSHSIAAVAIVNALTKPPLRTELYRALRVGITDPTLIRQLDDALRFDLENSEFNVPAIGTSTEKQSSFLGEALSFADRTLSSSAWAQLPSDPLSGYRIDILYCEASSSSQTDERKMRADRAKDELARRAPGAMVRVRLLPTLVQARPGYQSFLA